VIDSLTHQIPTNSDVGVAYFYFDFAIPSSTPYERLLSSLIWQLSLVSTKAAQILEDFYRRAIKVDTAHWTRQLAEKQRSIGVDQSVTLINCIIQSFARVYIVVDALDECSERGKLLQLLKTFWEKKPANVSCFLASRRESEIEDSVNTIADYHITCHGTIVDGDIRKYIQHRLGSEKAFKQWPENTRSEVERTLYTKSQGM
jgi:hypothetical protein